MKSNKCFIVIVLSIVILHDTIQPKLIAQSTNNLLIKEIYTDFNEVKGKHNKFYKMCVGAGRANEGLRTDWQEQLAYIKKECDFSYIRMHGLLIDDMFVYREDQEGNPIYFWDYVDKLYDFLLSIDMKPFVELGFMPSDLASGDQTICWWKGNVTPPKSYDRWAELIKNLIVHLTDRYGEDEIKSWYFEVWNEPNLNGFFPGDMKEYFKLYSYTAKAIKQVNSEYKVGGPATAGGNWIFEFTNYCYQNKIPVDFISTHTYGTQGFFDATANYKTYISKTHDRIIDHVNKVVENLRTSPYPDLEIYFTEWSASFSSRDPVHDHYFSAAFILSKLKKLEGAVNSMSYWAFTDIFEEKGAGDRPFHGGFGMLNLQGIEKPSFYAYKFLNQLGTYELINADSLSWVCKNEDGDIQALFWNFTNIRPPDIDSISNQEFFIRDIGTVAKEKVILKITNLPSGIYALKVYKVGYRVNDAYSTYFDIGSPNYLSKQQVRIIREFNNNAPISSEIIKISKSNKLERDFVLRENDVILVVLDKL